MVALLDARSALRSLLQDLHRGHDGCDGGCLVARMARSVDLFRIIGMALMTLRYAMHLRPASFPPRDV